MPLPFIPFRKKAKAHFVSGRARQGCAFAPVLVLTEKRQDCAPDAMASALMIPHAENIEVNS